MSDFELDPIPWQVSVDGTPHLGWRRVAPKATFTNGHGQRITDALAPRDAYSTDRGEYLA